MRNWKNAPSNSVNQIVNYLKDNPLRSENEILKDVFGFIRSEGFPNKKYADMLRRGLNKGLYTRIEIICKGKKDRFFYFIKK